MKRMNKKAQFFILSAVIIAAIIVSITSMHNYVGTGDAPKKFYYYSQQLEDETGSVVDYALYSDPTGGTGPGSVAVRTNMNDFLQQGITKTLQAYPDMELFACYSNITDATVLICQNNGTKSIRVNTSSSTITINGSREPSIINFSCPIPVSPCPIRAPPTQRSIGIANRNLITITPYGSKSYDIPIGNSSIQRGQFYFIATLNTTGGQYVSQSNDPKSLS